MRILLSISLHASDGNLISQPVDDTSPPSFTTEALDDAVDTEW